MPRPATRSVAHRAAAPLALVLALAATSVQANVKDGVDAWSAGDYDRAVAEWQGPATNGDPDALFNLAQAYRLGRGVDADLDRARALYAQAAEKGHVKAADNYGLLLFQQGEPESAMPLIRAAANRGDPRAQYVLGLAHFNADYAQKDWVRAYALLTLARSQGLPQATEALAQMDRYVPDAQKSEAQSLARELEADSARRRAAELAAADLGRPMPSEAGAPGSLAEAADAPVRAFAARPAVQASKATAPVPVPVPAPVAAASASATKVPARPVRVETEVRPRGDWRVQLGAFGVPGNAERLWSKLAKDPALSGTQRALVAAGRVTKLQAVGFASRADAQTACSALKRQGQACIVAAPSS
ncbi:MAG: SPOR domain-containing protein [Erythrobacter sp.]|jgi:cell division septation protein DedD|nr:SPOR domain-containing protein [Erythrobacter sp.]